MARVLGYWYYALDETGSAFLVALLALFRLLPLALFGVFIGSLADLIDTSRLLRVGIGLMTIVSGLMTILFVFDLASYSLVAAATFISGIFWASDMSLRRKLIGDIAGSDRVGAGMAIDSAISKGTRLIGPLVGGFIYQWLGGAGVFSPWRCYIWDLSTLLKALSHQMPKLHLKSHGSHNQF